MHITLGIRRVPYMGAESLKGYGLHDETNVDIGECKRNDDRWEAIDRRLNWHVLCWRFADWSLVGSS
jgi:hypothetical protein